MKWNSRWCVFQRQVHNFPFKRLSLTLPTTPTKSYLQETLPELILHQQPRNYCMLCLNMFKRKICSVVHKGYHELFENQPQKFCYRKVVHTELPEQRLHYQPPNYSMLCFGMFQLNIYNALLKDLHSVFGNAPKTNCFPKAVHTEPCPSKYFTICHQIPVCCALICLD